MKNAWLIIGACSILAVNSFSVINTAVAEATQEESSTQGTEELLSEGTEFQFEQFTGTVLKVYQAKHNDGLFRAYVTKWKDQEVVISDDLVSSEYKEGDSIVFIASTIKMPEAVGGQNIIMFRLVPNIAAIMSRRQKLVPADAIFKGEQAKGIAEQLPATGKERFYKLGRAAIASYKEKDFKVAKKLSEELLALTEEYKDDWNYGNAVHDSNQLLGLLALQNGDIEEAKKHLVASAKTDGSPQLNSFGPNMGLAKVLLARGENEVVLEYLRLCSNFWKLGSDELEQWQKDIEQGSEPYFGSSVRY